MTRRIAIIAPESVLRLIPSTSSNSMSLPLLNSDDCVDASPAILERISPLRLSEALISTRSQSLSRATASATVVFPTPAGPYNRTADLDGLPLDQESSHRRIFSRAGLLPAISRVVCGLYLTVQGCDMFFSNASMSRRLSGKMGEQST